MVFLSDLCYLQCSSFYFQISKNCQFQFLDTSSTQGVFPNSQMPTAFSDGVADPWFNQNSMATYVPTGPQGNGDRFLSSVLL